MDAHSLLAPSLPIGTNQKQIVTLLGEAQDWGKGIQEFTLLAYRDKTIQFSLRLDRLFLLAFYFRPTHEKAEWPQSFEALNVFSGKTTPSEVGAWLEQSCIPYRRTSVNGEDVVEAPVGVRFCFESGLLTSVQSSSQAHT